MGCPIVAREGVQGYYMFFFVCTGVIMAPNHTKKSQSGVEETF